MVLYLLVVLEYAYERIATTTMDSYSSSSRNSFVT